MDEDPALLARLDLLRRYRMRRERDASLATALQGVERQLRQLERSTGAATDAWCRSIPPDLLPHTQVLAWARGTLTVGVPDSATAYVLERTLAAGAETQLRTLLRAGSLKVRIGVHAAPPGGG